jgi:two-component system response regulator HydG
MQQSVLVVDDDVDTASLIRDALRKRGYDTETANSGAECVAKLESREWDVVVTDVHLGAMTGLDLCRLIRRDYPDMLAIVITGEGRLERAIEAIQVGAYDFIAKPVKVDVLAIAVSRAVEHLHLRREVRRLRDTSSRDVADGIAGTSAGVRQMLDMIGRIADSDATVLITGESGTGKELVARAIHNQSSRRNEPFVAVNCAAMPGPLLESELFGHTRGAFTDAQTARTGLFVQARGGTIFLDEIGEMPLEMQVKLLRVLQERKVRPVGGDTETDVKARIVTATNRHLEREVEAKRFRQDLYYRINVVQIAVPPLRERASDILLLAQYFLRRCAARTGKAVTGFSTTAARRLMDYDWPGNIRELENCIERAVALCRLDEITISDLPPKLLSQPTSQLMVPTASIDELMTIDELSQRYVRQVMAAVNGNKTHAARILGMDRRSLYRRLEQPRATSATGGPAPDAEEPAPDAEEPAPDAATSLGDENA